MQHEHSPDEQVSRQTPLYTSIDSAQPAANRQHDPRIEDFLDRVFARLVPVMPREEREARREAMRTRIHQSAAAHMELGSTENEALELTLAQVQRENAVAGLAVHQVLRTQTRQASARTATIIALGFFGVFYLLDQTRAAGHLWNHWFGPLYGDDGVNVLRNQAVANFYRFELIVLPIISGLATGLLSRVRPVRGTVNALALLALPAIVLGGIDYGLDFAGLWDNAWPMWIKNSFPNPIPAVSGIGFWLILGSLSACVGGWIRRRLPRAANTFRALRKRVTGAGYRRWRDAPTDQSVWLEPAIPRV